jgi:hypothetical protein
VETDEVIGQLLDPLAVSRQQIVHHRPGHGVKATDVAAARKLGSIAGESYDIGEPQLLFSPQPAQMPLYRSPHQHRVLAHSQGAVVLGKTLVQPERHGGKVGAQQFVNVLVVGHRQRVQEVTAGVERYEIAVAVADELPQDPRAVSAPVRLVRLEGLAVPEDQNGGRNR